MRNRTEHSDQIATRHTQEDRSATIFRFSGIGSGGEVNGVLVDAEEEGSCEGI